MKRLFFLVVAAFIAVAAQASESYRLPFVELQNGVVKIPFVQQEWVLGAERADWLLYLEKGIFKNPNQPMYEFHAATIYKKPYYSEAIKMEVSKIYTYGVMNCNEANLYILFEWYVDVNENLIFKASHEYGAYTVELLTPFTARNDVYNQICKDSV
jgi:hypothetical protein